MKLKKTVTRTEEVVDRIACDLCHKQTKPFSNWGRGIFNYAYTDVSCETGTRYPEGGTTTVVGFDICPECFMTKLVPWMEQQGATRSEREIEH